MPSAVVPNAFIIEIDTSAASVKRGVDAIPDVRSRFYIPQTNYSRFLLQLLDGIFGSLTGSGIFYSLRYSFDYPLADIFYGASVTVPADVSLEDLAQLDGILVRWNLHEYFLSTST